MPLKIDISSGERAAPEYGWGVTGEVIGNASTEELIDVVGLDKKTDAERLVNDLEEMNFDGKSWFLIRVVRVDKGDESEAHYIEASNLTHPGESLAA